MPKHIALIGCGFSGTSAFFQMVDSYPVSEITIFESTGEFGPGYPYREDECAEYLINNTTDTMCLAPYNKRAFVDWLKQQPDLAFKLDENGHLPRRAYGAFLKDVFASTCTIAAIKGIKVNLIPHEATQIQECSEDTVKIGWQGGETIADMAILTTGRCPDKPLEFNDHPNSSSAVYIPTHIRSDELDSLALDATVHVLGASLSAYDVVNRLFGAETGCRFVRNATGDLEFVAHDNQRHVFLCSRSGRLKGIASQSPSKIIRQHFTLEALRHAAENKPLNLEQLVELIEQDAVVNGVHLEREKLVAPYNNCKSIEDVTSRAGAILDQRIKSARSDCEDSSCPDKFLVDFIADAQVVIWHAFADGLLSVEAEQLYREKYETAALCYAAPCPVTTAEKITALMRAGRLQIISGVEEITFDQAEDCYRINHAFGIERAKILVNTTGSVDRVVSSCNQPEVVKNLVAQGLLSPYIRGGVEMKGASVDMQSFRATGSRNIYLANMMLWGPGFFTSSAFLMATLVKRVLDDAFHNLGK